MIWFQVGVCTSGKQKSRSTLVFLEETEHERNANFCVSSRRSWRPIPLRGRKRSIMCGSNNVNSPHRARVAPLWLDQRLTRLLPE